MTRSSDESGMRRIGSLVAAVLLLFSCGPIEPPVRALIDPPGGIASPYDYAGVSAALHERGLELSAPTRDEALRAMAPAVFLAKARAEAAGQSAMVVSVHLAIADSRDDRHPIDHSEVYVVETTGYATGNCISLFDAPTGRVLLGACFYPGRTHP
jgi:hypothetical protein